MDKLSEEHEQQSWETFLSPAKQGVGRYCIKEMIGVELGFTGSPDRVEAAYGAMTLNLQYQE